MSKLQSALQGVQAPSISMRELQQRQYTAAPQQAAQVNQTNYAGQLTGIAQGATQLYSGYQKMREEQGQKRKNEIMQKNMQPEEMRKLREEGILLYQDDVYAMRALDKSLGRQEAYSAEEVVQQRIAQGYYKSRQEMETERANLLESRLNTMGEAYGVAADNKQWFDEGFADNIDQRSFAIYNAMDKKVDEYNRNNAVLATDNEVTGLIKSGNGQHVVDFLKSQLSNGVIRTETDFESHLVKAMKELSQQPGSVDMVRELSNAEITMYGEKTTLRARLGEETLRTMENTAAQSTLSNNWEAQRYVMNLGSVLTAPDTSDPNWVTKGLDSIQELERYANMTQGDAATGLRVQIEQWKQTFNQKHAAYNDAQKSQIGAQQQQMVRLSVLENAVNSRMDPDGNIIALDLKSFTQTEATGKFVANDWNALRDHMFSQIDSGDWSPEQKSLQKMKLVSTMKDIPDSGFGAQYKETFYRVGAEMSRYSAAQLSGAEPPETPVLNQMMEFAKASPELFTQTFGVDFPEASAITIAAGLGVHPSFLVKGQARLEEVRKGAPEQQQAIFKEFANWEANQGSNIYQVLNTEQRESLRALYLGMEGMPNSQKIQEIDKHLKEQFDTVESISGVIPKSFLMANPSDPQSVSVGKSKLQAKLNQTFGSSGTTSVVVIGDRLVVYNSLRSQPLTFTKDMLMAD